MSSIFVYFVHLYIAPWPMFDYFAKKIVASPPRPNIINVNTLLCSYATYM